MTGEYIYKNKMDTIRIKIFFVEDVSGIGYGDEWDIDIFYRDGSPVKTFSWEAGERFDRKREAKAWAEREFGELTSINPLETVTEGWEPWPR